VLRTTIDGQFQLYTFLEDLDKPINRMATQISDLHDALKEAEREKFSEWLSVVEYVKDHETKSKLPLPGSCQWLFKKDIFNSWEKSSASSILWLHGIPGSGKSMLTYSVIIRLCTMYDVNASPLLAYFYCSRDTVELERADLDQVLRSILE
jgi:predicted ATPase